MCKSLPYYFHLLYRRTFIILLAKCMLGLFVTLNEGQGHRTGNGHTIVDLLSNYLQSKRDVHCLNIFWNYQSLLLSWVLSAWPWMKDKGNVIYTWCIPMYEVVTVPSLTMMTWNSFRGIACEGQTHTQTDRQTDRHTHTDRQIDTHRLLPRLF